MKKLYPLIAILFFFGSSSFASEDIESKVYGAIFLDLGLNEKTKNIVVVSESLGDSLISAKDVKDMIPGISDSAVSDFKRKSVEILDIGSYLPDIPNLIKVDNEKLQEIFSGKYKNPWQYFYKVYPNSSGILRLSQVAINASKNEAIVTTSFACGGLCGQGAIVYLKLKNGVWVVRQWKQVWVS